MNREIILESTVNTRHLGGYETPSGAKTKPAFIRSDIPRYFSQKDMDTLVALGTTVVIDLRYATELDETENPFIKDHRFHYYWVPLVENEILPRYITEKITGMGEIYIHFIEESKTAFRDIFEIILNEKGGFLFHCTIGKDRTGTLACLLLLLAGISEEEIVRDYAVSAYNLRDILGDMQKRLSKEVGADIANIVLGSKPEYIQQLIRHIQSTYGSAKGYLQSLGFEENEINQIIEKI